MAEKKYANEPARRPRGRPRADSRIARPNRVITFVTDRELQFLRQAVIEEDRSMASVVHRIIATHVNED